MPDLRTLAIDALTSLNANEHFTRGAILRQRMEDLAPAAGLDLSQAIDEAGLQFGQIIASLSEVRVIRTSGTDMYVGLKGAAMPDLPPQSKVSRRREFQSSEREWIRPDVYEAFTRVIEGLYFYIPSSDEFTREVSNRLPDTYVEVPSIDLSKLVAQREEFAATLPDGALKNNLLSSIQDSTKPLSDFRQAIWRNHLSRAWHEHLIATLKADIVSWANDRDIPVLREWFTQGQRELGTLAPQRLLATIAIYMTEEEVRSLSIPFRVVEAMYKDIVKED